jgi:5-methylcytosine-specific restriction protein A
MYGELGEGFAECHHRTPLGELTGKTRTRLADLAIVCANCHRILHRKRARGMTVEQLRERLGLR